MIGFNIERMQMMISDIMIDFADLSSKLHKALEKKKELLLADEKTVLQEIYNQYEPIVSIETENFEMYKREFCEFYKKRCEELSCYCSLDKENFDIKEVSSAERKGKIFCLGVFNIFQKQLFLERSLQKQDNLLEECIIRNLVCYLGNSYYFEYSSSIIDQLFENAIMLYLCEKRDWGIKDSETISIAQSMKRILANDVFEYEIKYGDIYFSDDSNKRIQSKIENMIRCIGGINFLQMMFLNEILPYYNEKIERYLIHRNKKSTIRNVGAIRVPYNYLLQIAIKCVEIPPCIVFTEKEVEYLYDQIIQLSSDYLNVLNLQGYTIFDSIIYDYKNIPVKLNKNILFEKMYTLNQYHPKFVKKFIREVYMPLFSVKNEVGYTANDYLKISDFVLSEKNGCKVYHINEIQKATGIKHNALGKILNDISIKYDEVNAQFDNFLAKTNYKLRPLIKMKNGKYFLFSSFFNGFAFCEVLYDKLEPYYPYRFNREKGDKVENLVKSLFAEKGFEFHCGEYYVSNSEKYQCDIVLETNEKILFLEVKNQPLPDSFEIGDDIETLRCLGEGMIKAQIQCFRHIDYLQNRGYIELENNGEKYKLEQKNRRVFCVSIASQEYLFLTDKMFSSALLESLLIANYHAIDEQKEYRLKALNELRDKLANLIEKIYGKIELKQVFFDTLFRSAQQIFSILNQSENLEMFVDYLTQPIYISDGSGDAYCQLLTSMKMRAEKERL